MDHPRKQLRALLIEDSPDDAELVLRNIRAGGYDVAATRVETGAALSAKLAAQEWDIIVSDYSLPSFNAPAALEIWSKLGRDTPFVVVTATIGEERAVDLLKAGAHDFVLKENLSRLSPVVDRVLREADTRRRTREMEVERDRLMGELRELVRIRDDFLSIASHELKTPLTSIQLGNDCLQRLLFQDPLTDDALQKARASVAMSGSQIERLNRLAEQLLDVSRIRTGRLALDCKESDLRQIVLRSLEGFRDQLAAANCPVEITAPDPVIASVDSSRLEEVLSNLMSNAIKYGAGNVIRVELSAAEGRARIRVQDQGIGVSKEDQERIFERFERAVPTNHYGGLGLGLYISRQILAAHQGRITVSSDPEFSVGSTFTVELPLAENLIQDQPV